MGMHCWLPAPLLQQPPCTYRVNVCALALALVGPACGPSVYSLKHLRGIGSECMLNVARVSVACAHCSRGVPCSKQLLVVGVRSGWYSFLYRGRCRALPATGVLGEPNEQFFSSIESRGFPMPSLSLPCGFSAVFVQIPCCGSTFVCLLACLCVRTGLYVFASVDALAFFLCPNVLSERNCALEVK